MIFPAAIAAIMPHQNVIESGSCWGFSVIIAASENATAVNGQDVASRTAKTTVRKKRKLIPLP
jgi:hypothetical protein